jgi:hypothetical protein
MKAALFALRLNELLDGGYKSIAQPLQHVAPEKRRFISLSSLTISGDL